MNEPHWTQILSALLVPVVAGFGVYIAWQQMVVAKRKLKHELFDRRFAIYDATREFLLSIGRKASVSDQDIVGYKVRVADAHFLLDEDLENYLNEIFRKALELLEVEAELEDKGPHVRDRSESIKKKSALVKWLIDQQMSVMPNKFSGFLKLES